MPNPYLIGKFLVLDDGESWAIARFTQRLTKTIYLVTPHCPRHGEELKGAFLVDLGILTLDDGIMPHAMIFEDWSEASTYFGPPPGEDEIGEDASEAPPRRLHS